LVVPYELQTLRTSWPDGIRLGHVVRFSIGFEATQDLLLDLQQAFALAFPAQGQ
jgi:cystathionine beta-lyase